jgi:RPA family protein
MSLGDSPQRQVARRVFSSEFNQATYTFRESDEERAPIFALLPTGVAANRVFVVGTLTETEDVGGEEEYWRGRVVDPVGTFFVYAGQYQASEMETLREADTPIYAAITGKPRVYETDDGDVNVSLRPESITAVDDGTRRRWVVETAERTLERIERFDDSGNEFADLARDHYDVSMERFRDLTIQALESLEEE